MSLKNRASECCRGRRREAQAWHSFDPSLGIPYHFNDNVMAHLSWNKGFKAGGWTTRYSAVLDSPPAGPGTPAPRYGPEYSKACKLGVKSEWLKHHLLVNADVYYTNYDAIQLNVEKGISPVYVNAGNAAIAARRPAPRRPRSES